MAFKDILGQDTPIALLRAAVTRGRLPSAYMFLGPHHVGKTTTALTLAKALNCAEYGGLDATDPAAVEACGACPSCRRIDEGVHPDVAAVQPDGQFIKIDQVREITARLNLIPFEARKRVIVLSQAERLNEQAANAFLKTLEEPPGDTLLILCVEQASRLPETIVSRCVPLRFGLLSPEQTRRLLLPGAAAGGEPPADGGDDPALAFSIRFAQGRLRPELPDKAPRWMQLRDEMIKGLEGLHRPIFHQVSQEMARWGSNDDWRFVLEWLESWFRDLALLGAGQPAGRLINGDRVEEMRACARWFTPQRAAQCHRRVLDTRDAIMINANKTLAMEHLWLGFKQLSRS